MKKIAILLTFMLFQTQIIAGAVEANANYDKKPAQQPQATSQTKQTTTQVKQSKDEEYLLKYNINDLEAAPWLNGGNRKI